MYIIIIIGIILAVLFGKRMSKIENAKSKFYKNKKDRDSVMEEFRELTSKYHLYNQAGGNYSLSLANAEFRTAHIRPLCEMGLFSFTINEFDEGFNRLRQVYRDADSAYYRMSDLKNEIEESSFGLIQMEDIV